MTYIYTVGQVIRNYFAATGGLITFFAPINEAFDRIPEEVERRLLRDRIWLEQVSKKRYNIFFVLHCLKISYEIFIN